MTILYNALTYGDLGPLVDRIDNSVKITNHPIGYADDGEDLQINYAPILLSDDKVPYLAFSAHLPDAEPGYTGVYDILDQQAELGKLILLDIQSGIFYQLSDPNKFHHLP